MSKQYRYKRLMSLLATGALTSICHPVWAAGFQLFEQNVTNLGTAYAGSASSAEDASIGYYNSAGLTRICREQLVGSAVWIQGESKLTVDNATDSFGGRLGNGFTKPRSQALVPAFHYANRLDDCWVFGFSVTTPFGLNTIYKRDSIARYIATRTDLRTVDLSPSLAYSFNNGLSLGVGVDFLYAFARYNAAIGNGTLLSDGFQQNTGEGWRTGYHVGAMYEFTDCTRLGLQYRSNFRVNLVGESVARTPISLVDSRQGVKGTLRLPETAVVSLYHAFDDCWAVMADATWTRWSYYDKLVLRLDSGVTSTTQNKWRDTWRGAVGVTYQSSDCWKWRLGYAYDQGAAHDQYRTIRVPDSTRQWAAIGAQYRIDKCLALELGYSHIFFKNANITEVAPTAGGNGTQTSQRLNGSVKQHADLFGLQLTWDFG